MTRDPHQVVPLAPALGAALRFTLGLTAIGVALATLNRLTGPTWLPAAAAAGGAVASAGWHATAWGQRRKVPFERLPDGADVVSPRASAGRRALKIAYALPMVVFLGAVHRHTEVTDVALTLAVPAWYGWLAAHTWTLSRRFRQAEARLGRPVLALAGPFEGCGGRTRLFVASGGGSAGPAPVPFGHAVGHRPQPARRGDGLPARPPPPGARGHRPPPAR